MSYQHMCLETKQRHTLKQQITLKDVRENLNILTRLGTKIVACKYNKR